jgi:hypothetical protein
MSPKTNVLTFRPDDDVFAAMNALRERDGVPLSEQIRRGLKMYLESKGLMKTERKRPASRRRS